MASRPLSPTRAKPSQLRLVWNGVSPNAKGASLLSSLRTFFLIAHLDLSLRRLVA